MESASARGMRKRDVLGKFSFRAPSSRFGLIALLLSSIDFCGFSAFGRFLIIAHILSFLLEVPILVIFYVVVLR